MRIGFGRARAAFPDTKPKTSWVFPASSPSIIHYHHSVAPPLLPVPRHDTENIVFRAWRGDPRVLRPHGIRVRRHATRKRDRSGARAGCRRQGRSPGPGLLVCGDATAAPRLAVVQALHTGRASQTAWGRPWTRAPTPCSTWRSRGSSRSLPGPSRGPP